MYLLLRSHLACRSLYRYSPWNIPRPGEQNSYDLTTRYGWEHFKFSHLTTLVSKACGISGTGLTCLDLLFNQGFIDEARPPGLRNCAIAVALVRSVFWTLCDHTMPVYRP